MPKFTETCSLCNRKVAPEGPQFSNECGVYRGECEGLCPYEDKVPAHVDCPHCGERVYL
jgi:hypothetical protein